MSEVFTGLAVTDHAAAEPWYERLFGEPPFMRPHDTESAWRLEEHAWVYVVQDAERAGRGLLTVIVDGRIRLSANARSSGTLGLR